MAASEAKAPRTVWVPCLSVSVSQRIGYIGVAKPQLKSLTLNPQIPESNSGPYRTLKSLNQTLDPNRLISEASDFRAETRFKRVRESKSDVGVRTAASYAPGIGGGLFYHRDPEGGRGEEGVGDYNYFLK